MQTITGTYGSHKTPCNIFKHGGWYCVEGSVNVNYTFEMLKNGVDVETISNYDMFFTASKPIESEKELAEELRIDMEKITDEMFVREMKILWLNLDMKGRNKIASTIRGYYTGGRAEKIINIMQSPSKP